MTKQTNETNSAEEIKPSLLDCAEALKIVREAIRADEKRLETIAKSEEESPVTLEGTTPKGYLVQMMVDPKDVAKIMLEYDYPIYSILGEEVSPHMWDELAGLVGLETVCSVDL